MNKEFFEALDALEKEGISKTYLLEKVEAALQTAFKKENNGQSNVRVSIDDENVLCFIVNICSHSLKAKGLSFLSRIKAKLRIKLSYILDSGFNKSLFDNSNACVIIPFSIND
jgi:hypothetical protein